MLTESFLLSARRFVRAALPLKGGHRFAAAVERLGAGLARDILIKDFDGDLKFDCSLSHHMGAQIFWRGFYSGDQLKVLASLLRPNMTFVDVGANQGEFSVFAAKRCASVISFEPVTANVKRLNANVRANGFSNVIVHQLGLSRESGELPIYGTFDGHNEGIPTLYQTTEKGRLLERVMLKRLDDVFSESAPASVDVMKIDVEGAELAVLEGAMATLSRYRPHLLMELNRETCEAAGYSQQVLVDTLRKLNYSISIVSERGVTPASEFPSFCNILAVPQ